MPLPTEPLPVYLERRERVLTEQIETLRKNLEPRERELAEIRRIRASLSQPETTEEPSLYRAAVGPDKLDVAMLEGLYASGEKATIKDKILHGLRYHLTSGAGPSDLRKFIKITFGEDVPLTSLSPQLSRLREEGLIMQIKGPNGEALWVAKTAFNALEAFRNQSAAAVAEPSASKTRLGKIG
jgi:hypothetical protein